MDITTIKILVLVVVALLILATLAGELRRRRRPPPAPLAHGDGARRGDAGRRDPMTTALVALVLLALVLVIARWARHPHP